LKCKLFQLLHPN